ncbi:unnamed protein product [Arctia plantaginis]|uniref:Uncharacterized protein n=1 Tax=Arctia plantaginis TaxID=874455 RepID=A0A8S1BUR1_ARCPL|nr:unnamed protein product [Arctia plantaginis]
MLLGRRASNEQSDVAAHPGGSQASVRYRGPIAPASPQTIIIHYVSFRFCYLYYLRTDVYVIGGRVITVCNESLFIHKGRLNLTPSLSRDFLDSLYLSLRSNCSTLFTRQARRGSKS